MNERVRAIYVAALKLSAEERQELAATLLDTLGTHPGEADPLRDDAGESSGTADDAPQQPTSDVLAKYLDV